MEKYVIRANKNHTVAAREAVQLGISKAKALNCELKLIFATFNQHAGSTVFNEAVGEHINSLLIKKRKCKISDVSVSIETQQTIKKHIQFKIMLLCISGRRSHLPENFSNLLIYAKCL